MAKVKAWEAEFVRKCQPLHPKLVGCLWFNPQPSDQEQKTLSKDEAFLAQFAAIALVPLPISVGESSSENQGTVPLISVMRLPLQLVSRDYPSN